MNDTWPLAITSHGEFVRALRGLVDAALDRDARTLWWLDPSFRDWPLDDAALLEQLAGWFRLPSRRLVMVAADWGDVTRDHPRFCRWRTPWVHALDTRRAQEEDAAEMPTLMLDDGPLSLQILDRLHWRGQAAKDAHTARLLRERFDALTQRSEPDFARTTLGL